MATKFFDGKKVASEKLGDLKESVNILRNRGIVPKLVSILVGDDSASTLYIDLKKKAAEKVGMEVVVKSWKKNSGKSEIIKEIKKLNKDKNVHGIMVQLPLPSKFYKKDRDKIIDSISKEKDVDGLREDSLFLTPTVKAVLAVLKKAAFNTVREYLKTEPDKVVIIGSNGFEGRKISKVLVEMGYKVIGVDVKTKKIKAKTKKADILISVTGKPGLVKGNMVKEGVVLIDVGAPEGDIDKKAYEKASFVSPVPGGIGPVTISCLLENLVEAAS